MFRHDDGQPAEPAIHEAMCRRRSQATRAARKHWAIVLTCTTKVKQTIVSSADAGPS